jgi:phage tail tube protein FII
MDNVIRGGNWYFNEINTWRVLDEVKVPALKFNLEAFSPGGHMMGVEWPEDLEPFTAEIKVKTNDPILRALCGRQPGNYISSTYYENLASFRDGSTKGRVLQLKGLISSVDQDQVKGLKSAMVTYTFSTIVTYRDMVDGRVIHQFNALTGPQDTLIDGANPFAAMASNLAITGGLVL